MADTLSPKDAALDYARRGWAPVPIPYQDKNPNMKGWQRLRLAPADIARHWNGSPRNVGVILGEPSKFLVDLDLDAPEALAAAPYLAPDTPAVFGRASKPRSHRLYIAEGVKYAKLLDPTGKGDAACLLEVRTSHVDDRGQFHGLQTVFPPSTHPSGERVTWQSDGPPAEIDAEELTTYAHRLAAAALLGRHWPAPGARHDAALALAGGLWRGAFTHDQAADFMRAICAASGDTELEDRLRALADTYTRGPQKKDNGEAVYQIRGWNKLTELVEPRVVRRVREWLGMTSPSYEEPTDAAPSPAGPPVAAPTGLLPGFFNLTDYGNAERLVARHGQELRYCHAWGEWLVWDGRRWAVDKSGEVERRAKDTIRYVYAEAAAIVGDDDSSKAQRKAVAAWAVKSENGSRTREMIDRARAELAVTPAQLDADPWLINCMNGVVDLRNGDLLPHDPARLMTKLAPVEFHPSAESQLWEDLLGKVTAGDAEYAHFLQRAAGYTLTQHTGEKCIFALIGGKDTGKTTFIEALAAAWGDYAASMDWSTLSETTREDGGAPRPDLVRLQGRRLVTAAEGRRGIRLDAALLKRLTGGDTIVARGLHKEPVEFAPVFKLWLSTNHPPILDVDDEAAWRRVLRLEFKTTFPRWAGDPRQDPKTVLRDDPTTRAAVFAWAVQGCLSWQIHGLNPPEVVLKDTEAYRAEIDTIKEYLEARCIIQPGNTAMYAPAEKVYADYRQWAVDHGYRPEKGKTFSERLKARHNIPTENRRIGGEQGRCYIGLGMLSSLTGE